MLSLDKIKEYVEQISQHVRWKKVRPQIEEELTNHIIDQRDTYIAQGLDEVAATEKAIVETGDITLIGTQLDRTHRPTPQWGMFAVTALLLIIGLLIQLFLFNDGDRPWIVMYRLLATGIGVIGMCAAYFSDFSLLGKYPKTVIGSVLLVSGITMLLSSNINVMYYAQYIFFLYPLVFALIIFKTRNKGYGGIALSVIGFLLLAYFSTRIQSATGLLLFAISGVVLLLVAVYKKWFGNKKVHIQILMIFAIVPITVILLMSINSNIWERVFLSLNPSLDVSGTGYVSAMTRELLNGAKWFGRGSVPEQFDLFQTDLMLTAIAARLGWAAVSVIIAVFLIFVCKGFILCLKQKNSLGLFVSLSIMLTFTIQVVCYVLFNFGFQISTPFSLPFISYGNIMTIINLGLAGCLLSVFRTGSALKDEHLALCDNDDKLLTWKDGKLTFNNRTHT